MQNSTASSGFKTALPLVAIVTALLAAPTQAPAADGSGSGSGSGSGERAPLESSFNAAVVSDYVFRGVSQTQGDPALQAGFDLTSDDYYAGAWASGVSFAGDDETEAEIDFYAGLTPKIGSWTLNLGAVAYLYPGSPDGADYQYVEAKIGASRPIGPATVGVSAYWSPDFFGSAENEAVYVQADAAWNATERWQVSAAVGRQQVSSEFDYTTWNVGAAYRLTDAVSLDLRYHDTDRHRFGEVYEGRFAATLKAAF